jgi:hypothetical protein
VWLLLRCVVGGGPEFEITSEDGTRWSSGDGLLVCSFGVALDAACSFGEFRWKNRASDSMHRPADAESNAHFGHGIGRRTD